MPLKLSLKTKTVLFVIFTLVISNSTLAQTSQKLSEHQINEEEAYAIGIQAAVWGRPLVEYNKTIYAGAKAGAAFTNYFRRYDNLKTAADRFVVTPNNVTIDAYANADLSVEPAVVNIPSLQTNRWYILQLSDTMMRLLTI